MSFNVEFQETENNFCATFDESSNQFGATFGTVIERNGGLTEDVKQALLDLFQHLAYTDADGQDYYDALYDALYPPAVLTRITAVYTQSGTVYPTTSLDDLKTDLVVTAHYADGTSATVTSYTLSGTLAVGTSTITVTYEGKTTAFNVTVTAAPATLSSISAVYTQSGTVYDTDTLNSLKTDLVVTAHYSDSTSETVPSADYTLSGTLTAGTSTITVSYGGKTTTFTVTVTAVTLSSISAVYTQSGTVYDTDSLDSLKSDLVVTATYSDSSTAVVPSADYTLSGTLTAGTSTITVSYEGKTDTFSVTVSEKYTYSLSDGLSMLNAGTSPGSQINANPKPNGEIILLYTDMTTKRRSFVTEFEAPRCEKKSTKAYPTPSDLTDTEYFPIKIPSDATGVSVSITPATQYISIYAYAYDDTNHYVCDFVNGKSQTGWALGTGTLSFPAGSYQYISLCSKYNSGGSSYPTDPTALDVTFTTT